MLLSISIGAIGSTLFTIVTLFTMVDCGGGRVLGAVGPTHWNSEQAIDGPI